MTFILPICLRVIRRIGRTQEYLSTGGSSLKHTRKSKVYFPPYGTYGLLLSACVIILLSLSIFAGEPSML